MSTSLLEKYPLPEAAHEIDELVQSDDLESLEAALAELNAKLFEHASVRQTLSERWWQLQHGAKEVRRRRVRAKITAPPPVNFFAILYDDELPEGGAS
jgi:hypothetical protein